MELKDVYLPKWPALVVQGEAVTTEQAMEILIRTDSWTSSTNDKKWEDLIFEAAGIKSVEENGWKHRDWEETHRFREAMGVVPLNYLDNRQIASCYIGGAHGWCHWDGRIQASTYNIGKHPTADEVYEEWVRIAEAFPFLKLWSQLYDKEQCEEGGRPQIEFLVSEGKVTYQEPTPRNVRPSNGDFDTNMFEVVNNVFGRERGCSIDTLKNALAHVRKLRGLDSRYNRGEVL